MRLEIGGRPIGADHPVFVVAEIGLNHGGDVQCALDMVDAAASAGASAVKLQSLVADTLVAAHCPAPAHVAATSLREFFAAFELDLDAHRAVVTRARACGLAVMTTPFSLAILPALEELGFDAYKIASGDLTFDPLIAAAARTGRPLVISTGMGELEEVHHALDVARRNGAGGLAVLHCVSAYPTPPESENLRAVATLVRATGVPTGLSDHGAGLASAVAAVSLGACIYERHFVLAGSADAIDRAVSSTPDELRAIVQAVEHTRRALGRGVKQCLPAERPNIIPSRRGLYATRALRPGQRIGPDDVAALRPMSEVEPARLGLLIGQTASRAVAAGEAFRLSDLVSTEQP